MLFLCWNSQSFHLNTGGVSHFITQAMAWTGAFCTFIVHGLWTVRKQSDFGWKWVRIRFADNLRWKFHLFLNEPGSARFAKVTVEWVYEWNFHRNKQKAYIRIGNKLDCVEGVRSVISLVSNLNRWSSPLDLFCYVPWKRDLRDGDWRLRLNDTPNAIGCTCTKSATAHRRRASQFFQESAWYGLATISRLLKIIGLFCNRAL